MHPSHLVFACAYLMLLADAAIFVAAISQPVNTGNATMLPRWLTVALIVSAICAQLAAIAAIAKLPLM